MSEAALWTGVREPVWVPSPERIGASVLSRYLRWLRTERGHVFTTYAELHRWSVTELADFWRSVWEFFEICASEPAREVLPDPRMPGTRWFPGARLNWAENVAARAHGRPAVISLGEDGGVVEISGAQLTARTAALAAHLRRLGVRPGDRVAGYLPNSWQAVVALLAAASVGATWVVCPPEYGRQGVLDRLSQVRPKVLIAIDGYRFGGASIDRLDTVGELRERLPTVRHRVLVRHLDPTRALPEGMLAFDELISGYHEPEYEQVPFEHPLWILFSSGTTGPPKGIVHSHGGILLEGLKTSALQADTTASDRVFIYTSTAWMLWNSLVSALAAGATIVTYDGSPTHAGRDTLFRICAQHRVTRFGTGAAYLTACEASGLRPGQRHDLSALRSISSTGSPLPVSTWHWVYDAVSSDIHLSSDCGGTDVASAFIGGDPLEPVYAGESQGAYLGVQIAAWSDAGQPVIGRMGEMVVTAPMPSMPVRFWDDPDGARYRSAYFGTFPGVWRHGDWMTVTRSGTYIVHGRSDSTINRGGVRMGSAEIYAALQGRPEVADSLVVGVELPNGDYYMPLFVVLSRGFELDDGLISRLRADIRVRVSPRHVPDEIVGVPSVPVTVTGKKLEVPVKKLLQGVPVAEAVNRSTLADPTSIDWYAEFAANFLRTRSVSRGPGRSG